MDNTKKTVFITGASRGIGAETALLFAKKGFKINILGRNPQRLQEVLSKCENASGTSGHEAFAVDLSNIEELYKFCENYLHAPGRQLHTLINNAGIFDYKRFEDQTVSDWDNLYRTNLLGPIVLTQKLLPLLKQNSGSIINVSSSLAHTPIANTAAYSAMKAAMNNWTKTLAIELAPYQVRVNSISPGIVDTPLHDFKTEEDRNSAGQQHLLKRVGQPLEVAESLFHIAHAEWMTGSDLILDGGISLS